MLTSVPERRMQLLLSDQAYTDRLAAFLRSLGQTAVVVDREHVDLGGEATETARAELEIYLRVWKVLYPEAEIELED